MLQPELVLVRPCGNLRLYLEYTTGEKRLFDVRPYANGSWFGELADPLYFKQVRLLPNGVGIEWPHGQDIAPHELYDQSVPLQG